MMSHSGSRGVGANIADHYSKLAQKLTKLPDKLRHLAWLPLDTEAGQEYWISMNLIGFSFCRAPSRLWGAFMEVSEPSAVSLHRSQSF